jgi:A/G-specific adenine glycosylase
MNEYAYSLKKKDDHVMKTVLLYYKNHGRHTLPWRKDVRAYSILVSEIMLQQTQVKRVLPKYRQWMKMYPTLSSLSQSSLKDVLMLWQGLGYQRRAKALVTIAKEYSRIPQKHEKLLELPGVGSYTASAICAFAYNIFSRPMLETNIRTAMIEFYYPTHTRVTDNMLVENLLRLQLHPFANKIGARNFYYALMDYGSYLKSRKVSHNAKSAHHRKQSSYKGSLRQLRAKVLFAVTHNEKLPEDQRNNSVIEVLIKENFITRKGKRYVLVES